MTLLNDDSSNHIEMLRSLAFALMKSTTSTQSLERTDSTPADATHRINSKTSSWLASNEKISTLDKTALKASFFASG
jgi:hypothetical protein